MTALSARLISVKKGGVRRSYMIPGLGWYLRVFGGQCQCQCKATSLWNILTLAKTILNIPLQILANLSSANYFDSILHPVNIKYTFLVTIMYAIWTHFLSSLFNWGWDKKHVEISTQWNQEGRFFTADHIFIDPICAGWVVPELCRGEVIILQWQASPGLACVPGIEVATSGEGVQGRCQGSPQCC